MVTCLFNFPSYYNHRQINLYIYQLILEHETKLRQPTCTNNHQIQQLKDLQSFTIILVFM